MRFYLLERAQERPFLVARWVALALLVSAGAVWVWAHEGHEPLPTRGAVPLKGKDGRVTGVFLSREACQALDLQTAPVGQRQLTGRVLAYAQLVAPWRRHAFATSRLAGRVEKLYVRPGQAVAADQVLADVRGAELENLQLELLTARTEEALAAKLLAAVTESYHRGAAAEQALLDARVRHQQSRNAVAIARAKWSSLGLAQADLDRLFREGRPVVASLPVHSPIAGTVIHADLGVGKVVEPTEHLFEVVDVSVVWVRIGVLERDLHRVREGQDVELTFPAYPGEVFRTRVRVVSPHLDPQTHLATVWAELTNPPGRPRFYPGLHAQAQLLLPGPGASIVVPAAAVLHDGVESYVLVVVSDTPDGAEYLRTPIVAGQRGPEWVEVLGGDVFLGGRVVTVGAHQLASFFVPGVLRPGAEARAGMGLRVEAATVQGVDRVVTVDGRVDIPADRRAAVSAQLTGTLSWIGVEPGQSVKAGQEVARVASLELQSMQLELLKVHLELGLVEGTLARLRDARRATPPRLLWETESRRNTLRHQRDAQRRKLAALGLSDAQLRALLDERRPAQLLPIRAPLAGRLVRFDRVLGQALKGEETILEVHDLREALLQGHVAEADLPHVRLGQPVRVRLTADPAFDGTATVVRSGGVVGADSRVLSVWARLDRPPSRPLLHGQLARVTLIDGPAANGVAVPLAALVQEGTRSFVFVEQPDGTFDRRPVDLGAADDRRVIVTRGLTAGERFAVAGTAALQTAHASIR